MTEQTFKDYMNFCLVDSFNDVLYTVSQKNCARLFLSELCQISTNFDNFWQKDGKEAKIMRGALIFHLIYFMSSHYTVLNADVPNCYITLYLLVLDCSNLHYQFNRRRHVI